MDPRGALAKLFLAGRSPEEQAARMARQHQQSGLGGPAGGAPMAPSPMTTGAIPSPSPGAGGGGGGFLPETGVPMPMPNPGAPFPPDLGVSPPHPADPMAASAPTGMPPQMPPQMPPPIMGVPPDLRGIPQNMLGGGLPLDLGVSPPRPPDPMRGAPTEIGAYEARRSRPAAAPKPDRKAQTKKAQSQFRLKAGKG